MTNDPIAEAEALLEEARRLPLGWRERNNLLLEAHLILRLAEARPAVLHIPEEPPKKAPVKKTTTTRKKADS